MLPRSVKSMYLDRQISLKELNTYVWLLLKTNPFKGFCEISFKGLEEDFRGEIRAQYLRKILGKLRSHRLVYYRERRGSRGTFKVWIVDFRLTEGKTNTLEHIAEEIESRRPVSNPTHTHSQPGVKSRGDFHNSREPKKCLTKPKNASPEAPEFTRLYNDNDNNKYIDIDIDFKKNYPHRVDNFVPGNYEEERCKEIAVALKEKDMRFILAMLKKYGLAAIEGAYRDTVDNRHVKDRRRYFNSLLTRFNNK